MQGEGWKVSQSTVYKHAKEGRLLSDMDGGGYSLKAVQKYARLHLMQADIRQKAADAEWQQKKIMAEVAKTSEQAKLYQIKRMVQEGKYVPKEDVEIEMAGRAAALEAGLKFMVQTRVGEWIAAVGGDEKKAGDLVRMVMEDIDDMLNEYATTREFQVFFEAEVEAEEEGEGEKD